MTVRRVIPSSTSSVIGGVTTTPLRTRKMFAAEDSETWPALVSRIASSKPARCASLLASAELT